MAKDAPLTAPETAETNGAAAPRKRKSPVNRVVKNVTGMVFINLTNADGSKFELPAGVCISVAHIERDMEKLVPFLNDPNGLKQFGDYSVYVTMPKLSEVSAS